MTQIKAQMLTVFEVKKAVRFMYSQSDSDLCWRPSRLAIMADVDPDTLLEWLQMGQGDERDMQLIALEQLCMLLLMSDNVDRCFET